MSEDLQARHAAVQEAISKRPPFVSGTLDVPDSDLKLYFGEVDDAYCLNFARATEEQLAKLTAACDPATFGVKKEDVLDESYRKAGKLDTDKFASLLKVAEYGLIDTVRDELLLEGADSTKQIACELYKLNVYGKDSFFKSHKDTPRSERMFGSLVIVLPTPHEGGALVLREDGHEWVFDYAAEIANSTKIAYVAFFGDIEHEVLTVASGHRVTLTYNLYFDAAPTAERSDSKVVPRSVADADAPFREALQKLLQDPALLPKGGYLAFGLRFMYPCNQGMKLQRLRHHLKGADAMVARVCKEFGLRGKLMVTYPGDDEFESKDVHIIMDAPFGDCYLTEDDSFQDLLLRNGGKRICAMGSDAGEDFIGGCTEALWVVPLSQFNEVKEAHAAYGNSPSVDYEYAYLAYFVKIKPGDARGASADLPKSEAGESHSSRSSADVEESESGTPEHLSQGAATLHASADYADTPLEADENEHDDGTPSPPRKRQRSEGSV